MKRLFSAALCLTIMANSSVLALNDTVVPNENDYDIISSDKVNLSELDKNSLIKLDKDTPITLIMPDGTKAEYELLVDDTTRSGSKNLSVKGNYKYGLYSVYVTLWAKATWSNRTVTINDQGISYTGTCATVQNSKSWITNQKGASNTYAKVRTTGEIVWYWILQGVPGGSSNWDFELWLDPANSDSAFLRYNDSNHT